MPNDQPSTYAVSDLLHDRQRFDSRALWATMPLSVKHLFLYRCLESDHIKAGVDSEIGTLLFYLTKLKSGKFKLMLLHIVRDLPTVRVAIVDEQQEAFEELGGTIFSFVWGAQLRIERARYQYQAGEPRAEAGAAVPIL